jgi:hypothetical protein
MDLQDVLRKAEGELPDGWDITIMTVGGKQHRVTLHGPCLDASRLCYFDELSREVLDAIRLADHTVIVRAATENRIEKNRIEEERALVDLRRRASPAHLDSGKAL